MRNSECQEMKYDLSKTQNLPEKINLPRLNVGRILSSSEIILGKYLYSVGGSGGGYGFAGICEKLDLTKREKWVKIGRLNEFIGNCSLCNFNNLRLYRIGGYTGHFATYSDKIEYLDIANESAGWILLNYKKSNWYKCEYPGIIQNSNNSIMILGGRTFSQNDYLCENACFNFKPYQNTIDLLQSQLLCRTFYLNSKPLIQEGQIFYICSSQGVILHFNLITQDNEIINLQQN